MKRILGLDLGTNSIGWAIVDEPENEGEQGKIVCQGSRIIPMTQDALSDFEKGNTKSETSDRTSKRSARRLRERFLLRRQRINRVLNILGFLPEHYAKQLDKYGKFDSLEPDLIDYCGKNEKGKTVFLFEDSFNEMVEEFKSVNPSFGKIPYDWTIYYLRKKALYKKISKEELAWVILQFNQKRGYNQLRDEEEKQDGVEKYYVERLVVNVEQKEPNKKEGYWYEVTLDGEETVYRRPSKYPIFEWKGQTKSFIKTINTANGKVSWSAPSDDDWNLVKLSTEDKIKKSGLTVGQYLYEGLLRNPSQRLIGERGLVRHIEREFYRDELLAILRKQKEFHPELQSFDKYAECVNALYPNNEGFRDGLLKKNDIVDLIVNNIVFYQRSLKTKKSLIANCQYEERYFKKDGKLEKSPLKCIAKSNPYFQEFRLWQFIKNLKIYSSDEKDLFLAGSKDDEVDITGNLLKSEEAISDFFDFLNDHKTVKESTVLAYFKLKNKKDKDLYHWNYVREKEYPGNTTRASILAKLGKDFNLDFDTTYMIWHLLYSVSSKEEINKALSPKENEPNSVSSKLRVLLTDEQIEKIKSIKFPDSDYGSYSEKAIRKLMPLMVVGKYWNYDNIDAKTRDRISKIITGEYDPDISDRERNYLISYKDESQFRNMPLWLACYVVYGRHSEAKDIDKWESPEAIDNYIKKFRLHSMHNPIVEKIVLETLRIVRDIWKQVERIDEIHVELGREMKHTNEERARISQINVANENTNIRIRMLLKELKTENADVKEYSPNQQEILKIYESYALGNLTDKDEKFKEISALLKSNSPSVSEIKKYKLWLEQKYQSPYTGHIIPLSRLFTPDYEIEHVIPQSKYFDDSMSNKVICESEVNKLKSNMLGMKFISKYAGKKVETSAHGEVTILSEESYRKFVMDNFKTNKAKMRKMLLEEIPDEFIDRQLNDSRYISKFIKGLLSNIVREKDANGVLEPEAVSKNLISCNGAITDRLKQDWGINEQWNKIILPRFQRMNRLMVEEEQKKRDEAEKKGKSYEPSEPKLFTSITENGHLIPSMPDGVPSINKKRIDHRHHAMDAIVIACTTSSHVNLLNNESAKSNFKGNRYDLQHKLRNTEKREIDGEVKEVFTSFKMPWKGFPDDVKAALDSIVVSFKQNLRVINKTKNRYEKYVMGSDGKMHKKMVEQTKGVHWSIRKSMHRDTVNGLVNLRKVKEVRLSDAIQNPNRIVDKELKRQIKSMLQGLDSDKALKVVTKYFKENKDVWPEVNLAKIAVYYFTNETKDRYYASRFLNELESFADEKDYDKVVKRIESITDEGIQKILKNHLDKCEKNYVFAFSSDGIKQLNENIQELNNGKPHKPIYKVRCCEKANKYAIGQNGNKSKKFVEADKGTNLFFAVYLNSENKRQYVTVPLNLAIDCQKKAQKNWKQELDEVLRADEDNKLGDSRLLFIISPNDLVYLPTAEQIQSGDSSVVDKKRIYKNVSFSGNQCFFVEHRVAGSIVDKVEFSALNKMEKSITLEMIKETCIPISVDRLGNITLKKI